MSAFPDEGRVMALDQQDQQTAGKHAVGNGDALVAPGSDRWTFGLIAVGLGLLVFFFAFWIAVIHYSTASDVVSVLGIVGTTVGTLVGAYFGVAVGSNGKAQSDSAAARAQQRADHAQARADQAHQVALRAAAMVTDQAKSDALVRSLT